LYNDTLETERQSLSYAKANHPVSEFLRMYGWELIALIIAFFRQLSY